MRSSLLAFHNIFHFVSCFNAMASNANQGATEHSFEVLSTSQTALTDDDFEVISQDLPASSDGYPSAATEHGLSITRRVAFSGATEHNALLTRTMAAVFKRKMLVDMAANRPVLC